MLRFLLGIVTLVILWISVIWINHLRDERAFAQERQEERDRQAVREAAIRPIADRCYAQLIACTPNKGEAMKMRIAFDADVAALGVKQPNWTVATPYFRSAQDLYVRLVLDEDSQLDPPSGIYSASACADIKSDLGDQFGPSQQAVYDEVCSEWLTRDTK